MYCQKILPAVYDDSLSYVEGVYSLVHKINEVIKVLDAHTKALKDLAQAIHDLKMQEQEQNKRLEALENLGVFEQVRNTVTGELSKLYVAEKQNYDALRVYASTWDEMHDTLKTWDELKADNHSYLEMDMFGNLYYGDGSIRAKYTKTVAIDTNTPGFNEE